MRKILFILLVTISTCAFAQDIIVTKEAQKVEAKIIEVSKSEIRYKELDNLEGPTFIINTEDVVTVIFANGKVVLYQECPPSDNANSEKKTNINDRRQQRNDAQNIFTNNSWSLAGRQCLSLPKPSINFKQGGKVVVAIIVDSLGKVVSAKATEGTTITDDTTIQLALKAAYKAKFSVTNQPEKQFGTITYIFKFN